MQVGKGVAIFVVFLMVASVVWYALVGQWLLVKPLQAPLIHIGTPSIPLRDFESEEELRSWVSGTVSEITFDGLIWCGQRASVLQNRAALEGYRLNLEVLTEPEFTKFYRDTETRTVFNESFAQFPITEDTAHMVCSALIGPILYYIEPSTGDVWRYGRVIGK